MSDPEIKVEEVPVAGKSGWNSLQQTEAGVPVNGNGNGNGSGKIVEWPTGALPYSLRSMRAQAEVYAITRALEEAGWNRKRAAKMLRISYRGLLYKISSHKITRQTKAEPLSAEGVVAFATNQIK